MKTWTLALALLLSIAAAPAVTAEPASLACGEGSFNAIFAVNQQAPVCNPFCVTSQCSSHSDCTAAPNGRCDFACPQVGCCVYK